MENYRRWQQEDMIAIYTKHKEEGFVNSRLLETLMSTIGNTLIHSFIQPFSNHLLNSDVPDMVLGVWNTEINRKTSIILKSL